jgi:hypothetical protein
MNKNMVNSKYNNPLECFTVHGEKTIGDYSYVLLVDETGQALIEQVASDNSTIMFKEMPNPDTDQKSVIASAITTFWATPDSGTFVYLFQL